MNIIIAMDSFKGSLSSLEAGNITARAAHAVFRTPPSRYFHWQTVVKAP